MQCGELVYSKVSIMTQGSDSEDNRQKKPEKETIHSGHFMVSHFEAEAQDDEYDVAVPVPDEDSKLTEVPSNDETTETFVSLNYVERTTQQVSIETSLTKLFQCMSLAYRQKLTSPRWNRFKGIRLRWKDKIRLNNVIWRCWHMQFIMKQNTMVCQFASPLDVDTHNKPEAVVLEGKYWKRRLAALSAEYKKWRMFYRNRALGWTSKDSPEMLPTEMDMFDWQHNSNDSSSMYSMMVDEDYMEFMSDTLFSTIQSNQPFAFPDPREIARGAGLADFIQPSLVQLQPNLEDFMDTLEPLQDLVSLSNNMKLPSVPEECMVDDLYRSSTRTNSGSAFSGLLNNQTSSPLQQLNQQPQHQVRKPVHHLAQPLQMQQQQQQPPPPLAPHQVPQQQSSQNLHNLQYSTTIFSQPEVSSFSSSRNLVARNNSFAQEGTVSIIYDQSQISGTIPTSSVPSDPNSSPCGTRPTRSPEGHLLSQEQTQQRTAETAVSALFQPQQNVQQSLVVSPVPSPQSPAQSPQSSVNYQNLSPTCLSPSPVQQSSSFPGQQNFTVSSQPSPPAQVPEYKTYSTSSSTSLTPAVDPALSTNVSPPRRQASHRSNSLTSEDDFYTVPKQSNKIKIRTHSCSGQPIAPVPAQRQRPPPLVSSISDPSLPTVGNSTQQPLLAHLLSNNAPVFKFGLDSFKTPQVVPILPNPYHGVTNSASHGPVHSTLPQTTTALLITTPVTMASVSTLPASSASQNNNGNQLLLNTLAPGRKNTYPPDSSSSASVGLCQVPSTQGLVMGPPKTLCIRPDSASQRIRRPDSTPPKEHSRRECHTKAEHKRRCNIKNGFDMLHSLIPQLHQNPNAKLSKAAMLQKGADYIQQLRAERDQLREEMQNLKQEIECLNQSISNCQSMLPATGAPVSRQRASKMRDMFDEYVRVRTLENWKFWIFSILVEPLLTSYNSSVSTASFEDLYRSTLNWVEQHCSLVDLRPAVLNSLRYLSTATEILTDPSKLPSEARRAVLKQDRQQ